MTAAAATSPTGNKVRPFYWSLRRELWEHRAIYVAPLALAALGLVGFALGARRLPADVRAAALGGKAGIEAIMSVYVIPIAAVLVVAYVVALLYCLSALYADRRDRSILFWKSLPVSDTTTVLAKAAVPLLVTPVVVYVIMVALHLLFMVIGAIVVMATGGDLGALFARIPALTMWQVLPVGLAYNALWIAPVVAWLLLASAFAKRTPTLWAFGPWVAGALVEMLSLRTHRLWDFLQERLLGGFGEVFSDGGHGRMPVTGLGQIDFVRILSLPDIWLGLPAAAAMLALAIWFRRRREPT